VLAQRFAQDHTAVGASGAGLVRALVSHTPAVSSPLAPAQALAIDPRTNSLADVPFEIVNARGGTIVAVGSVSSSGADPVFCVDTSITWAGGGTDIPPDRGVEEVGATALFLTLVVIGLCVAFYFESCLHSLGASAEPLHGWRRWVALMPASGATILAGMAFGGILLLVFQLASPAASSRSGTGTLQQVLEIAEFDETTFILILLPIIVFESGYALSRTYFFKQLGSILVFAVFGTIISTAVVGGFLYLAVRHGAVTTNLSLEEAFAFAALISAIDPVATLAVFGAQKVEPNLNALVYGESIINDAVSIVLYRAFVKVRDSALAR
jgi:hypothetical protein